MLQRRKGCFTVAGSDKVSTVSLAGAVAKHLDHPDINRCGLRRGPF
jgi:hypothetical protein